MATVTGLTADRMLEIEAASIVSGGIVGNDLILVNHGGDSINAGAVKGSDGPVGPTGPAGSTVMENRVFTGASLSPLASDAGTMVRCDRATAITLLIETFADLSVPVGSVIAYKQQGVGTIFVNYSGGVSLEVTNGAASGHTRARNSVIWLYQQEEDVWLLGGDFIEDV